MISHAYKALIANKLKTFLIIISLIFSIVSIFLISSISNGVISMYSSMLKSDGDIIITQAKISDTFFSNVDINLIKEIEYLKNINEAGAMIVGASPVEKLPIVAIYGVTQNRFKNYKLEKGKYPLNNEVIVGKSIFEQLPLNEQEKIFDKFYRTDKSRNKNSGGTGLGMSILKKIVDIHKGEITIKSEENKETTVTLSFNNK
ncbi:cell wall metabolism sensor histidine kinase WalK [Aliarcobacter cryaerophilus]|uniref:ATP-binding protein n=1 Tax=Aliarcobacter cryaerophilus TaxID=28198 RepID=UPI003DA49921